MPKPRLSPEENEKLKRIGLFAGTLRISMRDLTARLAARLQLAKGENGSIKTFALFQRPDGSDRRFVLDDDFRTEQQIHLLVRTHHVALICAFALDGQTEYECGDCFELLADEERLKFVESVVEEFLSVSGFVGAQSVQ